jgi:four helix bundle protein
MEKRRRFRFAEQLRGATLSITNNIAEGSAKGSAEDESGSVSDADFANFLFTSRRSVFEVANILMILSKDNYLRSEEVQPLIRRTEPNCF